LYYDSKDRLWIGTLGGVSIKDNRNQFQNYTVSEGLANNVVYAFDEDKESRIWMACYGGLSFFQNGQMHSKPEVESSGPDAQRLKDILIDSRNNLWMATYGLGITYIDNKGMHNVSTREGLSNNFTQCLYEDREGNYWIGTRFGLCKYTGNRFITYTQEDGLSTNSINCLLSDSSYTFFGTTSNGIDVYDEISFRNLTTSEGLGSNTIWSLFKDYNGNIWAGTTKGVARFNKTNFQFEADFPLLSDMVVYTIAQDRDSNLYFGTDNGVYYFVQNKLFIKTISDGLSDNRVRSLHFDSDGKLWIGTLQGLFCMENNGAIWNFNAKNDLPKNPVTSITSDRKGQIIFSSYNFGITYFNTRQTTQVKTISIKDGLSTNMINALNYNGKSGNLWVCNANGIDVIRWNYFLENNILLLLPYNKSNGYLGVETNAAGVDVNNNVWFASVNGAIKFNSWWGNPKQTVPTLELYQIKINNKDVNWDTTGFNLNPRSGLPINMQLKHNKNSLTFIYSGHYFTAPEVLSYRVKLDGYDFDWQPTTDQRISYYSNLPPGTYTFHVSVSANGKDWSESQSVTFTITPPFWKTKTFLLLLFLSAIGCVMLFLRLRTRNLAKAKQNLTRQVNAKTRELTLKNLELAKLSLVAKETANSILIFDKDYKLEWVNEGFTKLTGYTFDSFVSEKGNHLYDITEVKNLPSILDQCILQGTSYIYESELKTAHGTNLFFSSTITPVYNDQGIFENLVVIDTDISTRKKIEDELKDSLEEKNSLLREIHHRVKNNLQTIISLFNLQSTYLSDEIAIKAFREGQDRIKSIALIHDRFYQSKGESKINFSEYINRLVESLEHTYQLDRNRVSVKLDCEDITLNIDTAVPTGLIINEMVTNSMKHAFPHETKGEIYLSLKSTGPESYELILSDSGIGLPYTGDLENAESLGLQLIYVLTQQVDGNISVDLSKGTKYIINFKSVY
ncbi:MAG TPA: two-component regulator propeller domain-containing protein, partial [Bacteroidia bacterium]|nr:two-component regulator propeller domain-containing protein [Bacteroidia bacterium]